MLIITRRTGERIVVGEDIFITLIEVQGNTARIGIEAPRVVPVYREELWIAVKQENEEAARQAPQSLPSPETAGS